MPLKLQCPRCNRSVSIADNAAGKRVKCPHCSQTFLAPGLSATSSGEVDDWLSLDSDPVPAPTHKPAPSGTPVPSSKPGGGPVKLPPPVRKPVPLDSDEDFVLSELKQRPPMSDKPVLSELPAKPQKIPAKPQKIPAKPQKIPAKPQKPAARAEEIEYATEYRVTCPTCGSMLFANASQAGKSVKCGDCFSPIRIPPPPKIKKKQTIDLEKVEAFTFGQTPTAQRPADPFRKSAEELLAEAARNEAEETSKPTDPDVPKIGEWLAGVFGIFLDIGVIAHWILLSVFAVVPAVIAIYLKVPILMLGLLVGGVLIGLLTISCGFAILQSVANGEERVSEWPEFDIPAWVGNLFVSFAAVGFSAVPVFLLGQLIGLPSLLLVAVTMLSLYLLFPFVLLSMLDMGTPFVPFSAEVTRSVTKCHEAWGGLYFTSGLLFFGLYLTIVTAVNFSAQAAVVLTVFATIGVSFLYFAMIGRLAYSIGQIIEDPVAKEPVVTELEAKEPAANDQDAPIGHKPN